MRRPTLFALILFIVLGGLYWYTRQEDNALRAVLKGTPSPTSAAPGYLVEPYAKMVTGLTIILSDETTLSLRAAGDGIWSVSDAQSDLTPVDQAAANAAAISVQDLRILSEIQANSNLVDFGLDPDQAAKIEISFSDGTALHLRVGKATPIGSGYYALDENQPEQILVLAKLSVDSLLQLPLNPPLATSATFNSTPTP